MNVRRRGRALSPRLRRLIALGGATLIAATLAGRIFRLPRPPRALDAAGLGVHARPDSPPRLE